MALTVGDLEARLHHLPREAPIYIYAGVNGVVVQCEPKGEPRPITFMVSNIIIGGGGEAS